MNRIHIIGAGGHAKVVLDAIMTQYSRALISVYDSRPELIGKMIFGEYEIQDLNLIKGLRNFHVAVGDNKIRKRLSLEFSNSLSDFLSVCHPNSIISSSSIISEGCLVAAGAIIGPDSGIGHGTIINHMAIVDHDCQIGNWVHVAPNVTLGGSVTIEDGVFIGAGAVVLPGIRLGKNSIIGAGAVVTRDVPADITVVGVPAKGKL